MPFKTTYVPGRMNAAHAEWAREWHRQGRDAESFAKLVGVPVRSVKDAISGRTFKTYCAEKDSFVEAIDGNLLWYTSQREGEPE